MTVYNAWPLALREFGAAGVSGGPQNNSLSFAPEIGAPITRRRASSFMSKYRVNFDAISENEYTVFKAFFHETLSDGTLPFAWRHPMTQVLHRCRFDLSSDQPYEERRRTNERYDLSFNVIVLNSISNGAYERLVPNKIGYSFDWVTDTYAIRKADDTLELGTFSAKVSCPRTSVATYVDSDGILKTAAANTWRPAYDIMTGVRRGFKFEGRAATNNFINSENFASAEWTKFQGVLTSNATTAPDGNTTASKYAPNTTVNQHRIGQAKTLTAARWSGSIWFKAAEYTYAFFDFRNGALTDGVVLKFNLTTGAIVATNGGIGSAVGYQTIIEQYPNGWWRFAVSFTATAESWNLNFGVADSTTYNVTDGDSVKGIYYWGAQLEPNEPSSYIKTTGATATRAAETMTINIGAGTDYPAETLTGTIISEFYHGTILYSGYSPPIVRLGPTTDYVAQFIIGSSTALIAQFKNTTTTNINSTTTIVKDVRHVVGTLWNGTTDAALCVDNGSLFTISSYQLPNVVNSVNIGTFNLNASITNFTHYVDRFTNADMQALTVLT